MYFINACSTISHQNSFQNNDWVNQLRPIDNNSELISPNYKNYIDPSSLRRMSKIIRMGVVCAKDCIDQAQLENPDAIVVGTGLGCLTDTEKFLKNTLTIDGLIPPTAFIQSTHNTIAGQISLELKNHNYNITHTQNSLSFEHSLIDALLCLNEGIGEVLVGAVDEKIELMDDLVQLLNLSKLQNKLTSGSSFFILSPIKKSASKAQLIATSTFGLNNSNCNVLINSFLEQNSFTIEKIDLILFNTNGTINELEIEKSVSKVPVLNYEKYCGFYYTNSGFGMHLAVEILEQKNSTFISGNKPVRTILLYNNYNNKNIGLTLLKAIEA